MREILYLLGFFGMLTVVFGIFNLAVSIWCAFGLFVKIRPDRFKGMDRMIDIILLVNFFILFFTFIKPIFGMFMAYSAVASSGTGDPRVVLAGISEIFIPAAFSLLFCSFFFIVWFILRARHRQLSERMG
ncbi:hypothetical protein LLG96_13680 [bacterium]|nr:hypothetical protein [bacterium]